MIAVAILLSLVVASFFGHVTHWALHQTWAGAAHRGHMAHHLTHYPPGHLTSLQYRGAAWHQSGTFLFTPPLVCVTVLLGAAMRLCGLEWSAIGASAATVVVYALASDWFHDSFHLRRYARAPLWYHNLAALHFQHHRDMRCNYGILTFMWDRVFTTWRPR